MSAVVKPITGSFIEIEHPNRAERVITHDALCAFSASDWRALVRDMHTLGMDTLVLLSTALRGVAYFPFEGFERPSHLACDNAIEAILSEADALGQTMYIGVGFYGTADSVGNATDPSVISTALRAMETLYSLYGHHRSFAGWYIADEWCIWEHFDERFITYINTICTEAKRLNPTHRVIVAPFGTHCLHADDTLASQIARIDADAIAYQDELGVKKMPLEKLASRFESLARVHEKAGRSSLWVDTEIFTFSGEVYRSALLPAPFERVKAQLEAVSSYVEKVIAYTCQGMMTKPDTADLGDYASSAFALREEYTRWTKTVR